MRKIRMSLRSVMLALLAGVGCGGTEAPDPAIAVDPNETVTTPEGAPPGVGLRGVASTLDDGQTSAHLD